MPRGESSQACYSACWNASEHTYHECKCMCLGWNHGTGIRMSKEAVLALVGEKGYHRGHPTPFVSRPMPAEELARRRAAQAEQMARKWVSLEEFEAQLVRNLETE